MVRNLRTQGGKSLHVMSIVNGGDACEVLAQLVREGMPKRLVGIHGGRVAAIGGRRAAVKTLNLQQAAALLLIHPTTLQAKARTGQIPGGRPGRRWVLSKMT